MCQGKGLCHKRSYMSHENRDFYGSGRRRYDQQSFCKNRHDIPKDKIFDVMDEIRRTAVNAPVRIGDTVIEDCAGTGISVIATKNVESV